VEETLAWLRSRLTEVIAEGREEFPAGLDPAATATAIVAVLQGGYILHDRDEPLPLGRRRLPRHRPSALEAIDTGRHW
jgi:hypothetical protein